MSESATGGADGSGGASMGSGVSMGPGTSMGADASMGGGGATSVATEPPAEEGVATTDEPKSVCGDGMLDDGEECDDGNDDPHDGCIADCVIPKSCLEILEAQPEAEDGDFLIAPVDGELLDVHCDMTTDGGGYTFLAFEGKDLIRTQDADGICASLGMQLWIPRTEAHRNSSCELGDPNVMMRIMGLYPGEMGAGCQAPMHSDSRDCYWVASDGGPFWVRSRPRVEPNGSATINEGAWYEWDEQCEVVNMDDQGGQDRSTGFYCDVGDKWGLE
ncbi:MAG: fibrinogen-like YCDxxxxGGGW domain-containing protein [Myxococcota bacterium]